MRTLYYNVDCTRFYTDKKTGEKPAVIRIAWWHDAEAMPFCYLVRPPYGATMDPKNAALYGISIEQALASEITPSIAADLLSDAAAMADVLVAYNAEFHERNAVRMGCELTGLVSDRLVTGCAMNAAAPILNLPLMKPGGGIKSPSLAEACNHFGVPLPLSVGDCDDPIERGESVVRAVRGVWEAIGEKRHG